MLLSKNAQRTSLFILCALFFGCSPKERPVAELIADAETLLDSGQIEAALGILEQAQIRAGERIDVLEPLAFAYSASGDPMMAAMTFSRMAELVPERAEYMIFAADAFVEAGDLRGASARYREYLTIRPEDRAVWVTLAEREREQGLLRPALDAFLKAENAESRTSQQLAIAEIYLRLENLAQSQSWYARALEGDPAMRDRALLGLLETAIRAKRFGDAERLLAQLDRDHPQSVNEAGMGSVRRQLRDWRERQDAAVAAAAELQQRQPLGESTDATDATESAGLTVPAEPTEATETPEITESPEPVESPEPAAPSHLAEPTDLPEPDAPTDLVAARAAFTAGRFEEAVVHYKQALIQNDGLPEVWTELSRVYLQLGENRWAQVTASEAMRRAPENPAHTLQFLHAARAGMDNDRFLRELESGYRKFPENADIVYFAARTFDELGNFRNAQRLYMEFSEMAPPSHAQMPFVRERLSQLSE